MKDMSIVKSSGREYRTDIDGIRALAVMSVFFYHLDPNMLPGGFLGVDVFFVISGYLITGIILRESRLKTFSFVNFYTRRVKRIFPALFVVLLLSGLIGTLLLPPETYLNFMKSARYASAQLANMFFSQKVGYFSEGFASQPLLHTWSLGVEEQFYLFWPLLIYLCFKIFDRTGKKTDKRASSLPKQVRQRLVDMKVGAVFLLVSVVSFSLCYTLAGTNYNLAFYMFYTRALEFCVGGILALKILPVPKTQTGNNLIGLVGIVLLGYSLLFIGEEYLGKSFLRFGVLVPCLGTMLIIHADWKKSIVNRVLATTLPSYLGKISYSLYLYHWPVIIFWKMFSNTSVMGPIDSFWIIVVSILLSIVSYLLVEQPARRATLPDRRVLAIAALVILGFVTVFKNLEDAGTAAWRIQKYASDGEMIAPEKVFNQNCKKSMRKGVQFYECTEGDSKNIPIVALVGDSHSPHYLYATTMWAEKNGYNVKYLGVEGCPMLLGGVHIKSRISDKHERLCSNALPVFAKRIVNDPRVELIFMAQRFELFENGKGYSNTTRSITFVDKKGNMVADHKQYFSDRLTHTVETIRKKGKEPVILSQVPILADINACNWEPLLKKVFSKERVCQYDESFIRQWQQSSINFIESFAKTNHVAVVDPFPYFDGPLQNGNNIYLDQDHLNAYGAKYIASFFNDVMDDIAAGIRLRKNVVYYSQPANAELLKQPENTL